MPRIKINDLPKDKKLSRKEIKAIMGGSMTLRRVYSGPAPQRGGEPGGLGFLSNPLVLAGIVAAAIAIPLAIANDDDDAS